jgi:Skp family chaperone for outer membrane proteins
MDAPKLHVPEGVDARPARPPRRPVRRTDGPDRRQWSGSAAVVLLALVIASLSAAAVYGWQHAKVTNSGRELAAVRHQLTTSSGRATALDAEIAALRDELASTEDRLVAAKDRLQSSSERSAFLGSRIEALRGHLDDVRTDLRLAQEQSAAARQELARMVGSPLPDGTYRVRMLAAQVATSPPRILVSQPFTDGEWRLIAVVPGTSVSIIRPVAGDRTIVPLGRFGKILRRAVLQRTSLKTSPYEIAVVNGRIAKIVQKPPATT